jgi:pimeloyl-ACP methyl ester carboxylesterase
MKIQRGLVRTSRGYIHYRTAGGGRPIVLLHINQQSSALSLELIEALCPDMRPIAIDLPSNGMSDHVDGKMTIADYASCVLEVMDELGVHTFNSLGEALGAFISVELACTAPERLQSVILLNCPFYRDQTHAAQRHAPFFAGADQGGGLRPSDASGFPMTRTLEFMHESDPEHSPVHPTQSWMDRINVAQMEAGRDRWQATEALRLYDISRNLERIACPALVLLGEHFHYVSYCDEFSARIRNVRLEVVSGARFCMAWEFAEHIGQRVINFLR